MGLKVFDKRDGKTSKDDNKLNSSGSTFLGDSSHSSLLQEETKKSKERRLSRSASSSKNVLRTASSASLEDIFKRTPPSRAKSSKKKSSTDDLGTSSSSLSRHEKKAIKRAKSLRSKNSDGNIDVLIRTSSDRDDLLKMSKSIRRRSGKESGSPASFQKTPIRKNQSGDKLIQMRKSEIRRKNADINTSLDNFGSSSHSRSREKRTNKTNGPEKLLSQSSSSKNLVEASTSKPKLKRAGSLGSTKPSPELQEFMKFAHQDKLAQKKKIERLQSQVKGEMGANIQLLEKLKDLDARLRELQSENSSLHSKLRQERLEKERIVESKNKEISDLSETVDRILDTERQNSGGSSYRDHVEKLKSELEMSKCKITALEKRLEMNYQESSKLQNNSKRDVKKADRDLQKENDSLLKKMKLKDESIEHLMKEMQRLKNKGNEIDGSEHGRKVEKRGFLNKNSSSTSSSGGGGSDLWNKFSPGALALRPHGKTARAERKAIAALATTPRL